MRKIFPFIYFIAAVFLIVTGFTLFFEDNESYRLILNYTTESRVNFLIFRILFAVLLIVAGISRLKRERNL